MSYESSVNKLLELAGDYQTITSEHLLEDVTYKITYKELKEKLDNAISSLSVGDCALALTCDDKIIITDIGTGISGDISIFTIHPLMKSENYDQRFKDGIYQLMLSTVSWMARRSQSTTLADISRFTSYANLVVNSINKESLSKLRDISEKLCNAVKDHEDAAAQYSKYVNNISSALGAVAWQWFREADIKPGMKIGVLSHYDNETFIRTVKEATKDRDTLRISFKETRDVVTSITHININVTWFMNAKEHTDIARAVRWKHIIDYI